MDITLTIKASPELQSVLNAFATALTGKKTESTIKAKPEAAKIVETAEGMKAVPDQGTAASAESETTAAVVTTKKPSVSLEALRALLVEKNKEGDNRQKNKEWLTAKGSASLSTLAEAHYDEFHTHLKSL